MKKSKIKYEAILDFDKINANYSNIVKNTKHKDKIVKFDIFHGINIFKIYDTLENCRYKHGLYNIFLIRDPKYRVVMSENISDKLVNHLVSNVFLKDAIYPKLIEENVATRLGKGTNAAINLCKKYMIRMNQKYTKFYILKFDISKYFYNIDHEVLKEMMANIFEDKRILKIISEIIDSTDHEYINSSIDRLINSEIDRLEKSGNPQALERIKELKEIPHYEKGRGLGIGSLSNQIFAIFYLNGLDHYIKEKLGIKEYIRFMDDGIIFSNDKSYLQAVKNIIDYELSKVKLNLNKKTEICNSIQGFDFVGYRFSIKNGKLLIRVKNKTKKRMKKKFKILGKYDEEKLVRVKASYKGVLKYCTCKSLYKKYY